MTREEKIKDFAIKRFGNKGNESQFMLSKIQACIVGAKWADETMLDKACKWIENYVENAFTEVDGMMIELHGIELSEDFRKAMEEEL